MKNTFEGACCSLTPLTPLCPCKSCPSYSAQRTLGFRSPLGPPALLFPSLPCQDRQTDRQCHETQHIFTFRDPLLHSTCVHLNHISAFRDHPSHFPFLPPLPGTELHTGLVFSGFPRGDGEGEAENPMHLCQWGRGWGRPFIGDLKRAFLGVGATALEGEEKGGRGR